MQCSLALVRSDMMKPREDVGARHTEEQRDVLTNESAYKQPMSDERRTNRTTTSQTYQAPAKDTSQHSG